MPRSKGLISRAVVTPDKHFPYHDVPAINALCKAIQICKPTIYIDLGDVGEWESFSHWRWKLKKKPPLDYLLPELETDVIDVNNGMDIIDEALDKVSCVEKYITEGNHDNWLNMFVESHPYISKFAFNKAVKLCDRGYEYYPMGKHLKIGKLYFYHGHQYGGQYHTANHLRKLGCNVMYGHWHDLQHMTATHIDGAKGAWSIGCLKSMAGNDNTWLQNRKINWAHAFAIVDFFDGGHFTVDVVQIIGGKCTVWGELVDGNK